MTALTPEIALDQQLATFQTMRGASSVAPTTQTSLMIAVQSSVASDTHIAIMSRQYPTYLCIVISRLLPNNSFKPTPLRGAA